MDPNRDDDERARKTERGRRLAASLRRAAELAEQGEDPGLPSIPSLLPRESGGFIDGALAEKHLREHVCPNGTMPYGPYIAPERGVSLQDKDDLVRFPPHLQALFKAITPQMALALIAMLTKAVERTVLTTLWGRTWKAGVAIAVAAFAAAKWGVDQIPVVKAILALFKGPPA